MLNPTLSLRQCRTTRGQSRPLGRKQKEKEDEIENKHSARVVRN